MLSLFSPLLLSFFTPFSEFFYPFSWVFLPLLLSFFTPFPEFFYPFCWVFSPLFLSFFPSITSTSASLEKLWVPLSSLEFSRVPSINIHKKNVEPSSSLFLVFSLLCLFLRALSYSTCLSIFFTWNQCGFSLIMWILNTILGEIWKEKYFQNFSKNTQTSWVWKRSQDGNMLWSIALLE